jgi:hypothetical protein
MYIRNIWGVQTVKNNSWLILWYGLSCSIQIHIKYLFDGKDFQFDKYVLSIFSELFFWAIFFFLYNQAMNILGG